MRHSEVSGRAACEADTGQARPVISGEASPAEGIQRPELGSIVYVDTGPRSYNGSRISPAIVVRVWNDSCCNVRVIVDGNEMPWITSICHVSTISGPTSFEQPRPSYWFRPWENPLA